METKMMSLPESANGRPADTAPLPPVIQVVEFLLGNDRFAMDLFDVREVIGYVPVTKIPRAPPPLRGIIDLRGEVIAIVDLKQQMNIPQDTGAGPSESSRIIVLDDLRTGSRLGVLVDDVTAVSAFEPAQVDRTSASLNNGETAILGVLRRKAREGDRHAGELVLWIDIRKLIGTPGAGTGNPSSC